MPDGTQHLHTPLECLRCKARDASLPPEALLRALIEEDWDATREDFTPRAMDQDQAVAVALLDNALGKYIRAFGVDIAGARLNRLLMVLRHQARLARATARILEARSDINSRARDRYERGDIGGAHAIEAEATPDYPGKARDEKLVGVAVA